MILKNFQDQNGEWHDACILEDFDIEMFSKTPFASALETLRRAVVVGKLINPHALIYTFPEDNSSVNAMLSMLRNRYTNLKNAFFNSKYKVNAIDANNQYYFHKDTDDAPVNTEQKAEQCTSTAIDNWEALLSTRKIIALTGAAVYDGPEFKFRSNLHPSPAANAIDALAKDYAMNVIIPNALLALKLLGKNSTAYWAGNCFGKAIRHCMTTGKAEKSVEAWEAYLEETGGKALSALWNKYVANLDAEGNPIPVDHQWYFNKYVDLRCKDNKTKFRKGKNQDAVAELLKRMETEQELKTASRRKLMEMGISERLAQLFMKARTLKH